MDEPSVTSQATSNVNRQSAAAASAAAISGSVNWDVDLGLASRGLVAGLADLKLEPESVRQWLDQFAGIVLDLAQRRDNLQGLAHSASRTLRLGDLSFSEPIKAKLIDRLGSSEGGLGWALDGIVREMALIHEAMRRSLAAHLRADFDAESVLNRLNIGSGAEAAG